MRSQAIQLFIQRSQDTAAQLEALQEQTRALLAQQGNQAQPTNEPDNTKITEDSPAPQFKS